MGAAAALLWLWLLLTSFGFCPSRRTRAYDNDLRVAILRGYLDLGLSTSELSRLTGPSERTVRRYIERWYTYGSILPNGELFAETRGAPRAVSRRDRRILRNIIQRDCTLFIDEIRVLLILRGGTVVHCETVRRWIRSMGYTRQRLFHVEFIELTLHLRIKYTSASP